RRRRSIRGGVEDLGRTPAQMIDHAQERDFFEQVLRGLRLFRLQVLGSAAEVVHLGTLSLSVIASAMSWHLRSSSSHLAINSRLSSDAESLLRIVALVMTVLKRNLRHKPEASLRQQ